MLFFVLGLHAVFWERWAENLNLGAMVSSVAHWYLIFAAYWAFSSGYLPGG